MTKDITVRKTETPTPWRPFVDIGRWERDMEQRMNKLFGRSLMPWWPDRWLRAGTEIEALIVDMYYDKEELVISAELPGMEKDDVEVNLNNHLLTLKGNKKRQETIAEDDYLCRERAYGRFS